MKTVLFDLDGTIVDSGLGVTNAVMYALEKMGVPVPERQELYKFIGPPLQDSFEKFYSMPTPDALRAIEFYREYYSVTGKFENTVYDGIPELIETLKSRGKRIMLATSKPENFAVEILKHEGLYPLFDFCAGASLDSSRMRKHQVIDHALKNGGVEMPVIMVGDREHDVLGAKQFGIDCIGVLYGYGSRPELEAAGAKYIVNTALDVLSVIE